MELHPSASCRFRNNDFRSPTISCNVKNLHVLTALLAFRVEFMC